MQDPTFVLLVVLILHCVHLLCAQDSYSVPTPEIVIINSKGFSVTVPDEPGIEALLFHGSVNKEIRFLDPGTIVMGTQVPTEGKWVLKNNSVELKIGDFIYYWLCVKKNNFQYTKPYTRCQIKANGKCGNEIQVELAEPKARQHTTPSRNEESEEKWYWT